MSGLAEISSYGGFYAGDTADPCRFLGLVTPFNITSHAVGRYYRREWPYIIGGASHLHSHVRIFRFV